MLLYGIKLAFMVLIPFACVFEGVAMIAKNEVWKGLAVRILILALSIAFVIPCSTHLADYVAADLTEYVEETILETEAGANKMEQAMKSGDDSKTIFEKLSELFLTAINGVSDLIRYLKNTIQRCMNSIAILILTDCLMPVITFFALKWITKELIGIVIPSPFINWVGTIRKKEDADKECIEVGAETDE